ncbi:MAG TPA: hypothetical protein VN840_16970 [Streptosporangiaceae bacterium]|nr:hypothetical protein [Streptosporangiaceae bacterium]
MSAAVLLSLLAGGGAAASAAVAAPGSQIARHGSPAPRAAARVSWHKLSLRNGWKSANSKALPAGNPSYAISGGMVYLSGSVRQPSGSNSMFAVLPRGFRPAHALFITVYTQSDVAGTLRIAPNGQMFASNGRAQTFTSLAAISFPVFKKTWHAVALKNGWQSAQHPYDSGDPAWAVSGGIVHLAGSLHQISGANSIVGTLPAAARPAHVLYITVYTFVGSTGTVVIDPNGTVSAYGSQAQAFTSLAGISYPTSATKWHKLTLADNWTSSQSSYNSGDPAYAIIGPIVYLSGSMHQPSGTSGLFGVLPSAARPSHVLEIETYTFAGTYGAFGLIPNPQGWMFVVSTPQSDAQDYTSLAAISYPRNS